MSHDNPSELPVWYSENGRIGSNAEQDGEAYVQPPKPSRRVSRASRITAREPETDVQPTLPQLEFGTPLQSNNPEGQEGQDPRNEEQSAEASPENAKPSQPTPLDFSRPQKRGVSYKASPRFVQPYDVEEVDNGEERFHRAPPGFHGSRFDRSRFDGYRGGRRPPEYYFRFDDDYGDYERYYTRRPHFLRRRSDEHALTRDEEKVAPVRTPDRDYMYGGDMPVTTKPLGRTFSQALNREDSRLQGLDFAKLSREERREVIKLPWYSWLDSGIKNHVVAAIGELVGTTMFLFFAFSGTAVASLAKPANTNLVDTSVELYIALAFGFSLMVNVWVFYRISGGLFNPAVTLGLTLIRAISPTRAVFVFAAQLAGGIAAAGLASAMFPTDLEVRTSLSAGTTILQGIFIEAVLTFELVFTIFMLAAEKHRATFVAPVGIGLALFIAEMSGVFYTGGSLNPARSFGPCVIARSFNSEHWIYWVGPLVGACFAVALYKVIKVLHYEVANPGQDAGPERV